MFHSNAWYLVNESIPGLVEKSDAALVAPLRIGQKVELTDG